MRSNLKVPVTLAIVMAFALVGLRHGLATEAERTHVVTIENMKFIPETVQIRLQDRVTFKNNDLVPHTATVKRGEVFDSGIIKPGESWTVTPHASETIEYVCLFHPTMVGKIVVGSP